MVNYKCYRCGHLASQRCNFKNHLNRKNICEPLLEDISIEEIKFLYGLITEPKTTQNDPKTTQNDPKTTQHGLNDEPKITQFEPKITQFEPKITQNNPISKSCDFCLKIFKRTWHLKRHLNTCKGKKQYELNLLNIQQRKIMELEKKIEEHKTCLTTNNTTNINNVSNNVNINNSRNIIINNYGEENIKHLTNEYFVNILQGAFMAVPNLIKQIHFDPNHPENHNIKISNKKEPYVKIMKDNKWHYVDKKTELLDIIDSKYFLLKDKYYKILEKKKYKLNQHQKIQIDQFIDKYEEEDKQILLNLINKTELILLNN
jgi:hypothetical protein